MKASKKRLLREFNSKCEAQQLKNMGKRFMMSLKRGDK